MEHIPKDSGHAPDDPSIHLQQHNDQSTDISFDDLPDHDTLHRNTFAKGECGDSGSEEIGVSYPFTKAGDAPLDMDDGSWFCDDGVTADEHSEYDPKSLDLDLDLDDQRNQRMSGSTDIDLKNENNDQHRVLLDPVMAEYPRSPCSDRIGSSPIADPIGESFVVDSPRSSFRWTDSFCDEHEEIEEESEEDDDSMMIGCPNIFTQLAMRTGDFVVRHRNKPWFQVGVAVSLCAISVQMGAFTQNTLSTGDTAHSRGPTDIRQVETASVSHSGNVQHRSVVALTAADVHYHDGDRLLLTTAPTVEVPQEITQSEEQWNEDNGCVPILSEDTSKALIKLYQSMIANAGEQKYVSFDKVPLEFSKKSKPKYKWNYRPMPKELIESKLLTVEQVTSLTPDATTDLPVMQVGALTVEKVAALQHVDSLTAEQIRALTKKNVAALSADQMALLTPDQVSWLTKEQMAALTAGQVDALTLEQLAALTRGQAAQLINHWQGATPKTDEQTKKLRSNKNRQDAIEMCPDADTFTRPSKVSDDSISKKLQEKVIWSPFSEIKLGLQMSISNFRFQDFPNNTVADKRKIKKFLEHRNEHWEIVQMRRGFIAKNAKGEEKYRLIIENYALMDDDENQQRSQSNALIKKWNAFNPGLEPGVFRSRNDKKNDGSRKTDGESQLLLQIPGTWSPWRSKSVYVLQRFGLKVEKYIEPPPTKKDNNEGSNVHTDTSASDNSATASASARGINVGNAAPALTNVDAPPPIDSGEADTTRTPSTTEKGDDSSNDNTDDDWWHRESSIKGFNNGLVLMLFLSFLVVHLSVFSTIIAVITTANA